MKRKLFTLAFLIFSIAAFAQDEVEEEKGFQKDKLFVGGNFGLTFGDYTLINISPQVGYRFTNFVAAGIGLNAQYISLKEYYTNGDPARKVSQGVVGLNVFGRVYPIEQILLQAQPELNYVFGKQTLYQPTQEFKLDAVIVPSLLLGGGLVIPSGGGSFMATVFFDVLQNERSPYGRRPIYNFGYNFSLGGSRGE